MTNLINLKLCTLAAQRMSVGLPEPGLLGLTSAELLGSTWCDVLGLLTAQVGESRTRGESKLFSGTCFGDMRYIYSRLWTLQVSFHQIKASLQKSGACFQKSMLISAFGKCFLSIYHTLGLVPGNGDPEMTKTVSVLSSYHTVRSREKNWRYKKIVYFIC